MQNKTKRLSVLLGLALGAPAVVAPVVMPSHAPVAMAAESAEYPDVPANHWAYDAINKLSQAGIIEGMPNGTYMGNKPMTRYEFAVAIARILDKVGGAGGTGAMGAAGNQGPQGEQGPQGPAGAVPDVSDFVKREDLTDAINALEQEFRPELKALGVRVDDLDKRVTDIENRLAKPPKLTITPSLSFNMGTANYINQDYARGGIANGNRAVIYGQDYENPGEYHQFSYLDFSLRLADRVSDNVTLNAELRSLSGTQEDPWAGEANYNSNNDGDTSGVAGFYVRQAYATVDLNDLQLIIGRQHTKIAQGLLYDNDLSPTDQVQALFHLGPINLDAFVGSTNNNSSLGSDGGYFSSGAAGYIGFNGLNGSGSTVGFPSAYYNGWPGGGIVPNQYLEDSESLVHGSLNLFKIAGKPVQLGASYLASGVADQKGWGADLTVPLFNRNVGIEYVGQKNYANGDSSNGHAVNVTVPILNTKTVDLNLAYGNANDAFEYFLASSANPYEATWGEAVFDRPMALGAPLINGNGAYGAEFMAAKQVWDVNATLHIIKKFPIELRWYNAKGSDVFGNQINLGNVWTVGTDYQLAQGLDLDVKYGQYNPEGDVSSIKYFQVGANIGF